MSEAKYLDIYEAPDGTKNTEGIGGTTPWVCDIETRYIYYKENLEPVYLLESGKKTKLIDGNLVTD